MIILHNQHDKDSRDFVEKYGEGNTIIPYPECVEKYKYISAFPSVIITVPAYFFEPDLSDIPVDRISESDIISGHNVISYDEIFRSLNDPCDPDQFWQEIQERIEFVNKRAQDNPPKQEG